MPARLSAIMVHRTLRSAAANRLSEAIVGEVIGCVGIDLVLVGPPSDIDANSTDRLTLESVTGDVAFLDWSPISDTFNALDKIEFQGQRTPHQHDRDAVAASGPARKIYGFDLREFSDACDVVHSLRRIQSVGQIKTFSIDNLPVPKLRAQKPSELPRAPNATANDQQSHGELDLDNLLDDLDRSDV